MTKFLHDAAITLGIGLSINYGFRVLFAQSDRIILVWELQFTQQAPVQQSLLGLGRCIVVFVRLVEGNVWVSGAEDYTDVLHDGRDSYHKNQGSMADIGGYRRQKCLDRLLYAMGCAARGGVDDNLRPDKLQY